MIVEEGCENKSEKGKKGIEKKSSRLPRMVTDRVWTSFEEKKKGSIVSRRKEENESLKESSGVVCKSRRSEIKEMVGKRKQFA